MKHRWYELRLEEAGPEEAPKRVAELDLLEPIGGWFGVDVATLIREIKALGDLDEIRVDINSPGGDLFDGLALANYLRAHSAPVSARVLGFAASAASLVALAADTITMLTGSFVMIHYPWSVIAGDAEELESWATTLRKFNESVVDFYLATNRAGLERAEIHELLAGEAWLDAEEAVEKGFADGVDAAPSLAASAACAPFLARFQRVPEEVEALIEEIGADVKPEEGLETDDEPASAENPQIDEDVVDHEVYMEVVRQAKDAADLVEGLREQLATADDEVEALRAEVEALRPEPEPEIPRALAEKLAEIEARAAKAERQLAEADVAKLVEQRDADGAVVSFVKPAGFDAWLKLRRQDPALFAEIVPTLPAIEAEHTPNVWSEEVEQAKADEPLESVFATRARRQTELEKNGYTPIEAHKLACREYPRPTQ